jgi:2'-5' RNA ligase
VTAKRLFVGIMAGPREQRELQNLQSLWTWPPGARLTPASHFHITLHFLGEVEDAEAERLCQALATVPVLEMDLVVGTPGSFHGGIAFIEPQENIGLRALHEATGRAIAQAGLQVDQRPWHPHITLAKHAQGATPAAKPLQLHWPVDSFSLVASAEGRYHVIETWRSSFAQ